MKSEPDFEFVRTNTLGITDPSEEEGPKTELNGLFVVQLECAGHVGEPVCSPNLFSQM